VDRLVAEGKAYLAFDTTEELEAMRAKLIEAKVDNPSYNAITRMRMRNSLTLSEAETQALLAANTPYSIRMKVPERDNIRFNDIIRGWVNVHSSTIDDKVLMKSDGMPTYHLANVVDDHLMEISHVIRGEEWLPSAPNHVLLYQYFGWEDTMPAFAHLPLLLKPEGNGKLSKRDAESGGFPIFPLQWTDPKTNVTANGFREDGYLPEAMVNFLSLLGWNPGTEQELFSMEELIQAFSLERINKAGAKFDINKAKWFNQQYLKQQPDEELAKLLLANNQTISEEKALKLVHLFKERVTFSKEIITETENLLKAPISYDEAIVASKWTADAQRGITAFVAALPSIENFVAEDIKHTLHEQLEAIGIKMGKIMAALRLVVTGAGAGPDLMLTMEILGKEEVARRLEKALNQLGTIN
jgi:glutamyl-tRNA synthetase